MYNIKQLTNFDVADNSSEMRGIFRGPVAINHLYRIIPYSQLLGIDNNPNDIIIDISKMGYCTNDNEGKDYPIFITFEDGTERTFYIGKTGIFEFQPEEWRDINDDDTERTATVSVKQVLVPDGVPFVLDYCYLV